MTDMAQKLPLELWTEILGHTSVPGVLRLTQVNRIFHDAILASPLIQHKIDLFAAGFEYNAAAGMSLANSREALLQYRSNLETLCPIEKMMIRDLGPDDMHLPKMVGGVYGVLLRDSVSLFSTGSTSRGIAQKEWEIPLPFASVAEYSFCPAADVIAFAEQSAPWIRVHLRTLSNGGHHPAAQLPTIDCPRHGHADNTPIVSVTNSRLVMVAWARRSQWCLIVWNWRNGQILFELDGQPYDTAEFIDDYRLLVCLNPTPTTPPSIVVIDTEKFVEGAPLQTTFRLPPQFGEFMYPCLALERGAHNPSPAESLAPFHQDPAQRVAALIMLGSPGYPVFRVQALLELSKAREGSEIEWDEWENCVIIPAIDSDSLEFCTDVWVSGCRLFCFHPPDSIDGTGVKLFDFSVDGRAKHIGERVSEALSGIRYLSPTEAEGWIPWRIEILSNAYCGHDSIVLARRVQVSGNDWTWRLQIWTF